MDKSKSKKKEKRKGNLDQSEIDDPSMKNSKADMITEFLMISSAKVSEDPKWLDSNKVSHIINAAGDQIKNVFDPEMIEDQEVKQIVEAEKLKQWKIYGRIQYLTIYDWTEHKIDIDYEECREIFEFIEDATTSYSSCLVISQKNKCCTVVLAIIYLM